MTEDEAKTKICPMTLNREAADIHWECIASGCMAWRWSQEEPKAEPRRMWWPKTEDEDLLKSTNGPERPLEAAGADWIPMTGNEEFEDWDGGFWQEAAESHQKRISEARSKRNGFCGAYGPPLTRATDVGGSREP